MIISLIPARSGSKRVVNKNIRLLGGIPLMAWSIRTAMEIEIGYPCYVSTDSEEFGLLGRSYGAEVIIRPPELASDDATDSDVMAHALQVIAEPDPTAILYLRPTTPFRDLFVIHGAISAFLSHPEATGLRSVEEMTESAYKCFEIKGRPFFGFSLCKLDSLMGSGFTEWPNQKCPKTYKANGYIDIARVSEIQKGNSWGTQVFGFETPKTIEIDTEEDFWYAEQWLKRKEEER